MTDARFEIDLRQLRSDDSRRDNRIRGQGLEPGRFPTAAFVAAAPVNVGPPGSSGQARELEVAGDLSLHGVTKRVTLPVKAVLADNRIELVGSLTFPRSDFAIDPPSIANFVTVEPNATFEFRLFLEKG